jgi:type III restriction enzyme
MLVLETKGQDSEQSRTKRRFLDEWTRAANQHGGFGRWSWDVSEDPGDIKDVLERHEGSARSRANNNVRSMVCLMV